MSETDERTEISILLTPGTMGTDEDVDAIWIAESLPIWVVAQGDTIAEALEGLREMFNTHVAIAKDRQEPLWSGTSDASVELHSRFVSGWPLTFNGRLGEWPPQTKVVAIRLFPK